MLVCRDRTRGENVTGGVREQTGNPAVSLMLADLSVQQSIRNLAAEFLARGEPLHVLVNNAGVFNLKRPLTADGIETVFAVNHLSYFMLTLLLLDRIKQIAPARIVNVASNAHRWGSINFDDLGGARSYRSSRIYGQSKFANILFTYELARRLEGTGVTVNCVHPGAVATGLGANNGALAKLLMPLIGRFMRSPEQGAATQIYLAASPEVECQRQVLRRLQASAIQSGIVRYRRRAPALGGQCQDDRSRDGSRPIGLILVFSAC